MTTGLLTGDVKAGVAATGGTGLTGAGVGRCCMAAGSFSTELFVRGDDDSGLPATNIWVVTGLACTAMGVCGAITGLV